MTRFGFLMLAAATVMAAPATAGTLVVSGDTTIISRLVTGTANGNPALAGNTTFAQNLLGGGSSASIYRYSVVTTFPAAPLGEQLAGVYNGYAGISASIFDTAITADVLAGANLLVVLGRSNPFTAAETALVQSFLYGGGNVLLTGESANIGFNTNALTNTLLAGIGSTIRLGQVTEGIGDQFAEGAEIVADPLTAGITSFGYGRTTSVSGGRTLFINDNGSAFIAAEEIVAAVPEPATWAMMIAGFGMVGSAVRRRKGRSVTRFA